MKSKILFFPTILFSFAIQSMQIVQDNHLNETVLYEEWRNPLFTGNEYNERCYINENIYLNILSKTNTNCTCNKQHSAINKICTKDTTMYFTIDLDKCIFTDTPQLEIAHNDNDIFLSFIKTTMLKKTYYKITDNNINHVTITHEIQFTPWSFNQKINNFIV